MHFFANNFTYKLDYSPNFKIGFHQFPNGQAGEGLHQPTSFPPCSLRDGGNPPQLQTHIEQIIVHEKSLRGIMLSTASLFTFPPSALGSLRRSGVFSLSFGIQELLPGN